MTTKHPFLELRPTGFYFRRRVPARARKWIKPRFFCFSLRTHLPRDAAELARRLTAVSELCFNAEQTMPPEMMTEILVTYARLEIDTADRLRALTGPRTRAAAEASLALELAARASLRDAIFLCDREPALQPIRDIAARLGLEIDENEDDFAILADRMLRLLIELSEEKERRARGQFSDPQPYLAMALTAGTQSLAEPPRAVDIEPQATTGPKAQDEGAPSQHDEPEKLEDIAEPVSRVFHEGDGVRITVDPRASQQEKSPHGEDPRLLEIWDRWFEERSRGVTIKGAYVYEDEGKAARFKAESDTIVSTRKLVADTFGHRRMSEIGTSDWIRFNDMVMALPKNHGRPSEHRQMSCFEIVKRAKTKENRAEKSARARIEKEGLEGDAKQALLRDSKYPRIAPRTFQRHQKYLSSPLDYAVDRGWLSVNPFKPYVLGENAINDLRKGREDTTRRIWHSKDLAALLSTERWQSAKTEIDDPVYWVPLIALLHGLRSEEILQLTPDNVRYDADIHYFDVERGTGQSLKSNNARRMVPIHSQLIELGFLQLVDRQRRLGKIRIFDKVSRSKSKKLSYTANFTKKFSYYRTSRKVYDKRRDLHAMRSTFNSSLVAGSVPDTARRYLMGHKNGDVGITNYLPEGFPLRTLKAYIEQEQLDLTMVTRRFGPSSTEARGPRLVARDGEKLSA
ncbi:DUF6538 domain-containing protein [Marinovum sp.]|uniref:DUF6538 domain-containing protein n=1 Tax=Marinovum sp. TaxID=2024839 RepID=UPI003A91095F